LKFYSKEVVEEVNPLALVVVIHLEAEAEEEVQLVFGLYHPCIRLLRVQIQLLLEVVEVFLVRVAILD
jgi:metallophosphoesterase superfamily enzyme